MSFLDSENLQRIFDPDKVQPLALPQARELCLLAVLETPAGLDSLEAAFVGSFAGRSDVCLLLLPLRPQMAEQLARRSLADRVHVLDARLAIHSLPALLAAVSGVLVLEKGHLRPLQALLMQKPVLLGPGQDVPDWLSGCEGLYTCRAWDEGITGLALAPAPDRAGITARLLTREALVQRMLSTRVAVIFIWGRSGTLFIQSLLDQHPQILTLPPHPAFINFHLSQWSQICAYGHAAGMVEAFVRLNPHLFDGRQDSTNIGLGRLGEDAQTPIQADPWLFRQHLQMLLNDLQPHLPLSRKSFFIAVHYAYALTIGQGIGGKELIVHQFHSSDNLKGMIPLHEDFPDLQAIGMMRDPVKSFNSHLRVHVVDRQTGHLQEQDPDYDWEDLVCDGWYSHLYRHMLTGWKLMQKYFGMPVHMVRLEQLHADPPATMLALATALNLEWNDCLLESTFNGLKYWGDKSMIKQLSGFAAAHPEQSSGDLRLDGLDQFVLYGLMHSHAEAEAYRRLSRLERHLLPAAILLPSRLEREAFARALQRGDRRQLEDALLNLLERYLFSFRHLFGREIQPGLSVQD